MLNPYSVAEATYRNLGCSKRKALAAACLALMDQTTLDQYHKGQILDSDVLKRAVQQGILPTR